MQNIIKQKKSMNKDKWLSFLEELHASIRDSKGIKLTGLPALNEISNFLMLKFTEKYIDKEKLPEICKFSYLYEHFASDKKIKEDLGTPNLPDKNSHKLWHIVYDVNNKDDCVLYKLIENIFFKNYLKSSVSGISAYSEKYSSHETIQKIFNKIYKTFENVDIDYNFYDAFGSAYEQFKTDSVGNTGKNTGQHFTPVIIKQFIIDEIKPKYNELLYEPCCGSGGFIHTAYSYVHKNDKNHENKFKQNIYANECNPEIIKPLMINMLLHDIPVLNIKEQDSLDMSINCKPYKNKFDIIVTNPPFGMNTEQTKDEYWSPIETKTGVIKNSTAQFIVHIYHSLKDNGRAGLVLERGILNNGNGARKTWNVNFREWLINNVNITKIILLPKGIFEYTKFDTVLIFFTKGEKTIKIEYYDGIFKNKQTDLKINKPFKTLTYDQLKKQNWYIDANLKEEDVILKKVGWTTINDVCEYQKKSNRQASFGQKNGLYNFYSSSDMPSKCDECDYKNECIIIGTGGMANIKYDKMFSCSGDNIVLTSDKIIIKFLYYYFKLKINELIKGFHGTGMQHISKEFISKIQIPDLTTDHQKEIVKILDELFGKHDINILSKYIKDKPLFELLLYKNYREFKSFVNLIYENYEMNEQISKYDNIKQNTFNSELYVLNCKIHKLGDIFDMYPTTKHHTSIGKEKGKYRFYSSSQNDLLFLDEYEINKESIIIGNGGCVNIHYDTKFTPSKHVTVCYKNTKYEKICNLKYVYYYLLLNKDIIEEQFSGGGLKWLNREKINKLSIFLPSLADQQKLIDMMETIEKQKQQVIEHLKYSQEKLNGRLDKLPNAIKTAEKEYNKKVDDSEKEKDEEKSEVVSEESDDEIKKPKKVKKHVKKSSDDEDEKPKKVKKHTK